MKLPPEILIVLAVVFGAITHAAVKFDRARKNGNDFTFIDFTILFIVAVFAGSVFGGITALFWGNEPLLLILASSIGAFMGLTGLNRVSTTLLEVVIGVINRSK